MGADELVERAVEVAVLSKDAAAIDVGGAGLKAQALVPGLVAEVARLFKVSLTKGFIGGVVVFADLGGLTALIEGAGGLRGCGRGGCEEGDDEGDGQDPVKESGSSELG